MTRMKTLKGPRHEGAGFKWRHEEISLGTISSHSLMHDAKHQAFVLARYKFCAKMLEGKRDILELGCGDGVGLPIIAQIAGHVYCVDWQKVLLESIRRRLLRHVDNVTLIHSDPTKEKMGIKVDAAFSIDFIEHIRPERESTLMENITECLPPNGVLITGTPNITAARYASPPSAAQHINLKSMEGLRKTMKRYFENVFMFGMNDEIVHTGYAPMCQYIWSVAAGVKGRDVSRKITQTGAM